MADDDDEGSFGGLYENGHWIWDQSSNTLEFISDLPPQSAEAVKTLTQTYTGAIEFRDDVDLFEQIRFRRRYQRKLAAGEPDIITLQDIKDIAIYTAPLDILCPRLINLLHLRTTDRFLRALILCSAYYLQVADVMATRILELSTKVRTSDCEILEREYSDNLSDLRVLVAKEYAVMLIGGGDTKKFHHMGPSKRQRSLTNRDSQIFETFLSISVQIVWLALGRTSFHQIEMETNRLFKSEIFNAVEHNSKSEYVSKMPAAERAVLFGRCLRYDKKIIGRSPLINELSCNRDINYRLMGVGVIKLKDMSKRLSYFHHAVAAKEEELQGMNVSLGIIGMPRSRFDTLLRPVSQDADKSTTSAHEKHATPMMKPSSKEEFSSSSMNKSVPDAMHLYPEIILPPRDANKVYLLPSFLEENESHIEVNERQRHRWLNRLKKLLKVK